MAASPLQGVGLDNQVREDIYRQLRSRGLPEWLKTQLRSRLVHELQALPPPSASVEHQRAAPLCQLANDLILDHFCCLKYHCSQSVFTTEYADKVLSVDHLLSCLHVPEESSLAQMVRGAKESVLVVLLSELAGYLSRRSFSRESACQTDTDKASWSSLLAHKLSQLDGESSSSFLSPGSGLQSVDEQLAAHQHRCEEWAREQVKQEVGRIRKVELAQMRMAERESHNRELASARNQLHAEYSERLKHLKRVESKLHEQFRCKEQELESSVFQQRQTLLREMDSMKSREALSLRTVAVSQEALSSEATRVKSLLEEVREREASMQQVQQQYQRLAKDATHQLEQKMREVALQHQEELKREQVALKELQGEVEQLKGCLQESQAECRSLHGRLHAATEQLEETAQQHNSLQKRLLCLGDSPEASVRIGELQQQVETLRAQLESRELHSRQREEELQKSLEEMTVKLTMPPAQLVLLQAERKQEREVWREQVCSLTRERDCLQKAVVILKRRSDDSERSLQERDLQLLHHLHELEDAKAQIAVLERAVDGWVKRGTPLTQGKKGRGNSPVGKKVLQFASPVQTHVFSANASAFPKDPLTQVGEVLPLGQVDTKSIIMRLDQVAKDLDQSYNRMIDTSSVASELDHLSLLSPGSPLPPVNTEQSAGKEQVEPLPKKLLSNCGAQPVTMVTKTVLSTLEEAGFERQRCKAIKWPLSLDTLWQDQHCTHGPLESRGITLEPAPPTHTTDPVPLANAADPAPPISTTDPAPPTNTTDPAPPTNTTNLAPPTNTTDPALPTNTTDPAPPTNTTDLAPPPSTTDLALPPKTTGLAPRPNTADLTPPTNSPDPAPPTSRTDPTPPASIANPAPPTIASNLTLPTWEVRHSEREQERQQRRMEQEAACRAELAELGGQDRTGDDTTPSPSPDRQDRAGGNTTPSPSPDRQDRAGGNTTPSPSPDREAPLVTVAQDEVTDPVMQRYMQLVLERRQEAVPTYPEVKGGGQPRVDEFGLPLSADEHCSFGGASSGDDPFEDW